MKIKLERILLKWNQELKTDLCSQTKIYRTLEARIFEYVTALLLLAIWLISIWNFAHANLECVDLFVSLIITISSVWILYASYHPSSSMRHCNRLTYNALTSFL